VPELSVAKQIQPVSDALAFAENLQRACDRIAQLLYFLLWASGSLTICTSVAIVVIIRQTTPKTIAEFEFISLGICALLGLLLWGQRQARVLHRRRALLYDVVRTLHEAESILGKDLSPIERSLYSMRLGGLDLGPR
jgi:hypothetical protein